MSEEVHEIRIHRRKRMAAEDIVFYVFNTIFLLLFAIVTLYPVLNTLAVSFNEGNDAVRGGIHLWPRVFSTKNYEEIIFNRPGIRQGLWITVARTVLGTFTSLAANALLSFILSRKKFLFKSGLSLFWIITMYASAGLIPGLILLSLGVFAIINIVADKMTVMNPAWHKTLQDLEEMNGSGSHSFVLSLRA